MLTLLVLLGGCGDLLDVDLPGQIETDVLDVPDNAALLTGAVISEFECAFAKYIAAGGLVGNEFNVTQLTTHWFDYDSRRILPGGQTWATATCDNTEPGVYTSLSVARWMGDRTAGLLAEWTDAQVPNRAQLRARVAAYTGYAYLLLGEAMCAAVFDDGPVVDKAGILALAESRLTEALALAQTAGLTDILNMARVGRARTRLNQNRKAEAAADAQLVPAGFVKNAVYSSAAARPENRIFVLNSRSGSISVETIYRNLTFGGVADPRVRVTDAGRLGADGRTPLLLQNKYPAASTPIPIARTAEARLIIAEAAVAAGDLTTAVNEINALHTAASIPLYAGGTGAEVQAQIVEERTRELFLESHHYGDMLRYSITPFPAPGAPFKFGGVHGPAPACFPLPEIEQR
jgi:hypothetical protein